MEEVPTAGMPDIPAEPTRLLIERLGDLEQRVTGIVGALSAANRETLAEPAPGLGGSNSRYAWTKTVLHGSFGHLGEIEALIAPHGREVT